MSEFSEDRQAEKMVALSEKMVVIDTKLDGITNTLNMSLIHLKDTVERNHKDITEDLNHVRTSIRTNSAAAEKLLDKKLDRSDFDAHCKEGNDRYGIVLASIEKKADHSAFTLVQKLVFGFVALVLAVVVGAVIGLVVLKPEPHRQAPAVAVAQAVQPQGMQQKPLPNDPL